MQPRDRRLFRKLFESFEIAQDRVNGVAVRRKKCIARWRDHYRASENCVSITGAALTTGEGG
jgi:predicted phosphoribosyltransferase